jgi:hypothetical protein
MQLDQLLAEIEKLPHDWHKAGSVTPEMLRTIVRLVGDRPVYHSMETGSGKTTLLFSHLSRDHKVFAVNFSGGVDTESISLVRASPLFNAATVEYIEGPTQRTLPKYQFEHPLQLALIDGPHGYPFPDMEYYYIYPHMEENGVLIVDDIHIPTIRHLFDFLKEDDMFRLVEVVDKSAFFVRTNAPLFDPYQDGWWLQNYNKKRFPIEDPAPAAAPAPEPVNPPAPAAAPALTFMQVMKSWIPAPVKRGVKQLLGMGK